MIKGISRQIVEITNTGNPYFERAWLVVKPSFTDQPEDSLQVEAERALSSHNGYSGLRRARRMRRYGRIALLLAGGALALVVEKIMLTLIG